MLFLCDSTLAERFGEREPDEDELQALENIATSVREGNHLLTGHRTSLNILSTLSGLTLRARGIYSKAGSTVSEMGHITERIRPSVEVTTGHELSRVGSRIRVPLVHFVRMESVRQTRLIAESIDDAETLALLGDAQAVRDGIAFVRVCSEVQDGGGSNTFRYIDRAQRSCSSFSLFIVDSDRICPDCRIGETARRAIESLDDSCALVEVFVLPGREVENLLPVHILNLVAEEHTWLPEKVERLRMLSEVRRDEARQHVDIKRGLLLSEVFDLPEDGKRFWLREFRALVQCGAFRSNGCEGEEVCLHQDDCRCVIASPLGDRVLEHVKNSLRRLSRHKLAEVRDLSVDAAIAEVGRLIYSWCCGSEPIRT